MDGRANIWHVYVNVPNIKWPDINLPKSTPTNEQHYWNLGVKPVDIEHTESNLDIHIYECNKSDDDLTLSNFVKIDIKTIH